MTQMTQATFNLIKEELLQVSSDTYYTEGDLWALAEKYNLVFMGVYQEHIPQKTKADVGDYLCFPNSNSMYEVLEVLQESYRVILDKQNNGYITFREPKYVIIPMGVDVDVYKDAHPQEFI